jgi:uncharacterized membrane protein
MVPRASVIELDMTVDEALKYIISMGVAVSPVPPRRSIPAPAVTPQPQQKPSTSKPEAFNATADERP